MTTREEALLTAQVSGHARGEEAAGCYGERATEVDHAGEGAAMEDVEAVLSGRSKRLVTVVHVEALDVESSRTITACHLYTVVDTYRVHLLDIKLEVDSTRSGGCHTQL